MNRILFATFLLAIPAPALAHKVYVSAWVEGRTLQGEAYFHGHAPAIGATVTVLDPVGEKLGQTKTDDQGQFQFPLRVRCDHQIQVDAGEGHGAQYRVPRDELPADLPDRGPTSGTAAAESPQPPPQTAVPDATSENPGVGRQLAALHRKLDAYHDEVRLHDVLGGLGYLAGLAGVSFYFLGVRRREQRQAGRLPPREQP